MVVLFVHLSSSAPLPQAPHCVHIRSGVRYGDTPLIDTLDKDALLCPFNDYRMGVTGEECEGDKCAGVRGTGEECEGDKCAGVGATGEECEGVKCAGV